MRLWRQTERRLHNQTDKQTDHKISSFYIVNELIRPCVCLTAQWLLAIYYFIFVNVAVQLGNNVKTVINNRSEKLVS